MNKTLKILVTTLALSLLSLPAAAQATDTGGAGITMAPGTPTVTFTSGLTFGSVTLTGEAITDQISTANLVLEVNDNSGDGDGWILAAASTDFTGPTASGGMVGTIPASAMTLGGSATTFTSPNGDYAAPTTLADIDEMSTANQTFVTAGAGEGVGLQTVTVPAANVLLDIPFNAEAGAYSATVTFTLTDSSI